ncbi:MAG: hypothetical protein O2890_06885 [Cyanobacteria bacterium]|nr:hypothetical protein [Cyanobacteriota bacterium]
MNPYAVPNPIPRSRLRLWAGRHWHTLKRRWQWQFAGIPFARQQRLEPLPVVIASHKSVLMRQLKDVWKIPISMGCWKKNT